MTGKWADTSVLIIAPSKSLSKIKLMVMLFIAVVIEIVTLVGLFITGIMLNSKIRLTEF